jgi:hypothetical protein
LNGLKPTVSAPPTAAQLGAIVDRLALPAAWTVRQITAALERELEYRIIWSPLPMAAAPGLCGLVFTGRNARVVFHRRFVRPCRPRQVIAHAAAHLLLDHSHRTAVPASEAAAALTGTDTDSGLTTPGTRISLARDGLTEDHADQLEQLLLTKRPARLRRAPPHQR